MPGTLRNHWPEYLCEAALLGLFMISACAFAALIFHPASPLAALVPEPLARRALMGLAMGATSFALIRSPLGQRSGAHMNPSLTLAYLRLGKVDPTDAAFYVAAQFAGAMAGISLAGLALGSLVAHPSVNHVATIPGASGPWAAFAAEAAISFALLSVLLAVSNSPRLTGLTPLFAGSLVALWITIESPISGTSMNPARTFGSAWHGGIYTALWVYFTAPLLGMLLAGEIFVRRRGAAGIYCAKLDHLNDRRCIFRCGFPRLLALRDPAPARHGSPLAASGKQLP